MGTAALTDITRNTLRLAVVRESHAVEELPMYADNARIRRDVFAGSSLRLMLAIVAICAITLATGTVAGAAQSLYAQVTSSHQHHGKPKGNGSKAKTPAIVTQ